ncbi:MAG: hypothetical protein U0132_04070 [Gemmatimonadaceae bacterium]
MKRFVAVMAFGTGMLATTLPAQNPQKLPAMVTTDTVNVITVQNARKKPIAVYLEYGRFDRRLGVVPALGMSTLRLPAWALEGRTDIQLFVRPDGEGDLSTQHFSLPRRAHIGLLVPPEGGLAEPADSMQEMLTPEELATTTLTVENARAEPVTVLAQMSTFAVRLGDVRPNERATLRLPKSIIRADKSIVIFVHLPNGQDMASERIDVRQGQHAGLRVPAK